MGCGESKRPPPDNSLCQFMKRKFGSESLAYLDFWSQRWDFPRSGSLDPYDIRKLEENLDSEEKKVENSFFRRGWQQELKQQRKVFDLWKSQSEHRDSKVKFKELGGGA